MDVRTPPIALESVERIIIGWTHDWLSGCGQRP
jgi:hypothetical protein